MQFEFSMLVIGKSNVICFHAACNIMQLNLQNLLDNH